MTALTPRVRPVTHPELEKFLVHVQLTGDELGFGAWGVVEEVVIPGARVAAKRLHPMLIEMAYSKKVGT